MLQLVFGYRFDYAFGTESGMPWKSKDDMKHFVSVTSGEDAVCIMGPKTFKTLYAPLKGRTNIVVLDQNKGIPKTINGSSPDQIINEDFIKEYVSSLSKDKKYSVIGGLSVLEPFLEYADSVYMSEINEVNSDKVTTYIDPAFIRKIELTMDLKKSTYINNVSIHHFVRSK